MRRITYIWELASWPDFRWRSPAVERPLADARAKHAHLLGRLLDIGFDLKLETQVAALSEEVTKTSAIEGESLQPASVRSSVARRLGLRETLTPEDRRVEGVVEMMIDATTKFTEPLTAERLFGWHAALLPNGHSGMQRIRVGAFRDDASGPMQVISGPLGRERVHFQAPPAKRLKMEVKRFLAWFDKKPEQDGLLRAALAHLWLVTLHPFDDGNGRLSRAAGEMAIAQLEQSPQRFFSLSGAILRERKGYYDVLERTQNGSLDVTEWLLWFLGCFSSAIEQAERDCSRVLRKAAFFRRFASEALSERQKKVLGRVLKDFDGPVTAKKWAALGKCSLDSAQRDITQLVESGLMRKNPGGSKNTSYSLVLE